MTKFVALAGTHPISVSSPSRVNTPVLKIANLTKGNLIRVTANFNASPNAGFYYEIKSTANDVKALTPAMGVAQGSGGWSSATRTAYFMVANVSSSTGVEDADFEVLFSAGDLDGQGRFNDFLLEGSVVSSVDAGD